MAPPGSAVLAVRARFPFLGFRIGKIWSLIQVSEFLIPMLGPCIAKVSLKDGGQDDRTTSAGSQLVRKKFKIVGSRIMPNYSLSG